MFTNYEISGSQDSKTKWTWLVAPANVDLSFLGLTSQKNKKTDRHFIASNRQFWWKSYKIAR